MSKPIPSWRLTAVEYGMWTAEAATLGIVLAVGVVAILNPWLLPALEWGAAVRRVGP